MASMESATRRRTSRQPKDSDTDSEIGTVSTSTKTAQAAIDEEDRYSPWLDILRVLTFLLAASCGLSYLLTNGRSFFWGVQHRPQYLRLQWWQMQWSGPLYMTLEELAAYDGSDPAKPVYLSINGSIYDVSAGRRIYGPGGSYHVFAGVDASRGFVTGCFDTDRTGDMRGVEEMFLPLDNPATDSQHWTPQELEEKKAEELAVAHQRVHDALKHWVDFFAKSKKYHYVGQLRREPGWEGERKPLCKPAQDSRVPRKAPAAK